MSNDTEVTYGDCGDCKPNGELCGKHAGPAHLSYVKSIGEACHCGYCANVRLMNEPAPLPRDDASDAVLESPLQECDWCSIYIEQAEGVNKDLFDALRERDEANERSHKSWESACRAEAERDELRERSAQLIGWALGYADEPDESLAAAIYAAVDGDVTAGDMVFEEGKRDDGRLEP